MPFQTSASDQAYPHPTLVIAGFETFQVATPFVYVHGAQTISIQAGFDTNFASVPALLRSLMSSYGRQTLPAIMHDELCVDARALPDRTAAYVARSRADDLFRAALHDQGVAVVRRNIFWSGVVIGRLWEFAKARLAAVVTLSTLFTVSFYAGLVCLVSGRPLPGALALLAPVLLSLLWQREAIFRVLLIATYIGVPVLLLVVVGFLVRLWVRGIPEAVQWLVSPVLPDVERQAARRLFRPSDIVRL